MPVICYECSTHSWHQRLFGFTENKSHFREEITLNRVWVALSTCCLEVFLGEHSGPGAQPLPLSLLHHCVRAGATPCPSQWQARRGTHSCWPVAVGGGTPLLGNFGSRIPHQCGRNFLRTVSGLRCSFSLFFSQVLNLCHGLRPSPPSVAFIDISAREISCRSNSVMAPASQRSYPH